MLNFINQDIGRGRGVFVSTYGCQMNVNDTERIYSLLEMANFIPVNQPEEASIIIINSCSVREKPVHKVHSEVGRYRKIKEKNPDLRIGIGGCVGQQEKENLLKDLPLVDFVFGTDAIDELPLLISKLEVNHKMVQTQFYHREPYKTETLIRDPGISTFVNVTKGCDNFCTFCIVPFTRGRERSRLLKEIIDDINSLILRGVKEVTLLGQNVNSYHSPCGARFSDLLKEVVRQTDISRVRFTTSHPKDFDETLVAIMAGDYPRICEYIHLPVQSGSSDILMKMNRGYTREEYLNKIKMIRKLLPQVVFSTDIIVGFPGESEEQFQDTLSLLGEVGFETLFAFKYSPRPFTKASKFSNQIDEEIKNERLQRLLEYQSKIASHLVTKYKGEILDIMVEKRDGNHLLGRSSQNKLVYFDSEENLTGKMVRVKILEAHPSTLKGELIS